MRFNPGIKSSFQIPKSLWIIFKQYKLQVTNASLWNDSSGFLDDSSETTHGVVSIDTNEYIAHISILASILSIKNGK